MTDVSHIFSIRRCKKSQKISLCGHLEAVIGKYFLSQAGNPEAYWYAVYYDASIDEYDERVEIADKNLIGYIYYDNRVAFVLNRFLEKFIKDTSNYQIYCIGVNSLDEECLQCSSYADYNICILPAVWMVDDFLDNEEIPFDYKKFERIDAGIKYLNPKHFSVKNFVMYCKLDGGLDFL